VATKQQTDDTTSTAEAEAPVTDATITIDKIAVQTITVPIVGMTPLIVHRFSEKAKGMMLAAMTGQRQLKEPKDPQAEYQAAFYRIKGGGYGFPSVAFKLATIGGARFYGKSVTMTSLRQYLFFYGDPAEDGQALVPITGEPVMREDVTRVARGGTTLTYRPMFSDWSAVLQVRYVTSAITQASVLSLIEAGGMGVGVGEWRPERDGDFGTYRIDPSRKVEVLT